MTDVDPTLTAAVVEETPVEVQPETDQKPEVKPVVTDLETGGVLVTLMVDGVHHSVTAPDEQTGLDAIKDEAAKTKTHLVD